MPSSINSTSSSPGGLITTGATDNELVIQTDDTTAISIDASQNVTVAGSLTLGSALGVAQGGTGASTLTANNVILGNGTSTVQFVAPSTSGNILTSNGTTWTSATPSKVAQMKIVSSTATTSGSTAIPADDTIPQSSEGMEAFTLDFTPLNASSTIIIYVCMFFSETTNAGNHAVCALFKDSGADALATSLGQVHSVSGINGGLPGVILYQESAGSTTLRTYKVRFGSDTGTIQMNRIAGVARYGGTVVSSMTVTEVLP
jgi:hypothetical protein